MYVVMCVFVCMLLQIPNRNVVDSKNDSQRNMTQIVQVGYTDHVVHSNDDDVQYEYSSEDSDLQVDEGVEGDESTFPVESNSTLKQQQQNDRGGSSLGPYRHQEPPSFVPPPPPQMTTPPPPQQGQETALASQGRPATLRPRRSGEADSTRKRFHKSSNLVITMQSS